MRVRVRVRIEVRIQVRTDIRVWIAMVLVEILYEGEMILILICCSFSSFFQLRKCFHEGPKVGLFLCR